MLHSTALADTIWKYDKSYHEMIDLVHMVSIDNIVMWMLVFDQYSRGQNILEQDTVYLAAIRGSTKYIRPIGAHKTHMFHVGSGERYLRNCSG